MKVEENMNPDVILSRIKEIAKTGGSMNKKDIKKLDPELMKNALYYFPSWEHALKASGIHN